MYLPFALFVAISVGQLRNLAGTETLIAGYAVFVALTAVAIWKVGAAKTKDGYAREHAGCEASRP